MLNIQEKKLGSKDENEKKNYTFGLLMYFLEIRPIISVDVT